MKLSIKSHYRQGHSVSQQSCRTSAYFLMSNSAWLITSRLYANLASFSCSSSASSAAAWLWIQPRHLSMPSSAAA